jgi:hypothetical protein
MMKISKRINNLEFRSCFGEDIRYEVIQWQDTNGGGEHCYTLAFFNMAKEGYELRFCGSRPFDVENYEMFWQLIKYAQRVLDADFELMCQPQSR